MAKDKASISQNTENMAWVLTCECGQNTILGEDFGMTLYRERKAKAACPCGIQYEFKKTAYGASGVLRRVPEREPESEIILPTIHPGLIAMAEHGKEEAFRRYGITQAHFGAPADPAPVRHIRTVEWLRASDAPKNETLQVWGNGAHRFARKDELGQWRNMAGVPLHSAPTWYMPVIEPPEEP